MSTDDIVEKAKTDKGLAELLKPTFTHFDNSRSEVLRLRTVHLHAGDIGLVCEFMHNGERKVVGKLFPLGIQKPITKKEAMAVVQNIINHNPQWIQDYDPHMQVDFY